MATTLLNAVTVAGAGTALSCSGASKVIMTVTTPTNFIGEVIFEGSIDAGSTYFPMIGNLPGTKTPVDRITGATLSGKTIEFEVDGFDFIRPNVKSISAGSVTAVAVATAKNASLTGSTVPDTSPVPSKIVGATISVPIDKRTVYRALGFSTTTALAASAVYTSTSLDGIQYRRLTGKAFADQAGTLDIQHSDDGTTWDTLTSISVAASTPVKFDEPLYTRYIQIVYTNGATAQTAFRLSAYTSAE